MLVLRCLIGVIAYIAAMLGVMRIPVSTFAILMNTSPFWAAILGYIISRDLILKFEVVCMFGCFCGVFILT
jgi:drug/metabolite transporter (DMT)-like permease